jgi:hypothetical protein
LRKRLIGSRENKERKDKVGNTFLPPPIRTLLVLTLLGEKYASGREKVRKEKTK